VSDNILRIIELQAENVKRLKAVRLKPDRTLVKIEGKNAAGKSSVLDAIGAALGGGKRQPDLPVRTGSKKASVTLDLGELKVERRWTAAGGTTLEVTGNDGIKLGSPQAVLDKLIGDCTFDPLQFIRARSGEQAKVLMRLAGLDWGALDAERATVFAERTAANRDAKAAQTLVGVTPPKPPDMTPVDIGEIAKRQEEAAAQNRKADEAEHTIKAAGQVVIDAQHRVDALEKETEAARQTLSVAIHNRADSEKKRMPRVETGDLSQQIAEAQAQNAAIEHYENYKQRVVIADDLGGAADKLTERIDAIDAEKTRSLNAAKFPLEGLAVDGERVTLNDVPLSQASSAEQLRVAVAIGLAEKRPCRVLLIRDGSLLDDDSMGHLHSIACEYDAQVFLERVADKASSSAVFIEDGEIVEGAQT